MCKYTYIHYIYIYEKIMCMEMTVEAENKAFSLSHLLIVMQNFVNCLKKHEVY